jgi:DNA-binding beta-propeller fold protein YncE
MHRILPVFLIFALYVVLTAPAIEPRRGLHKRLFVVPTPGKVTIDGKLDDWDLSGRVMSYISDQTRERKNGKMAMMYDDEALYVSAQITDPSPMMNRHDPEANPDKVWNADSVQVRIVIDREEGYPVSFTKFDKSKSGQNDIQHLLLWYYTVCKEPGLQLRKDMDYKVPEQWRPDGLVSPEGFDAVYRRTGESSYVFEYRIPWSTLDADNPPRAGDIVSGTIQYNFSRPDGLKIASGGGWARDIVSEGGFPWQQSSVWGKFIFAEKGNVPVITRATGAVEETPRPLTFDYNLPEDGVVTVSLWDEDDTLVRNVVCAAEQEAGQKTHRWDGLDYRGQPVRPGRYTWRGIYHDPITTEFKLSVHNSGTPPYKTSDGTGGWGGDHTDPITAERFGDGMILAWPFGEAGWGLIRVDAAGDKKASSARGNATCLATDFPTGRVFAANPGHYRGVRVFEGKDFRPVNISEDRGKPQAPDGMANGKVTGLEYSGGKLFVAYRDNDVVAVNDGTTGALLDTWKVPQPGRLAAAGDGSVLAISNQSVLNIDGGEVKKIIDAHLQDPRGIAVDEDGRIYVTNDGALQNVAVFSADGEYLRSIGKRGGRPRSGRFDSEGMLEPAGCAIGPRGRLWVAEHIDAPKRVSVWDTASGRNLDQFFGGSSYSTWVMMDPQRPDEAFCHNVLWKIDLEEGTKRPYSTLWRSSARDMPPGPPVGSSHGSGLGVITAANGHQYGWGHKRVLYLRDGAVFKPIIEFMKDGVWMDENDDQRRQEQEIHPVADLGRRPHPIEWVDEGLTLYSARTRTIFQPIRIREDGVPVYDFENPEKLPFSSYNPQGPTMFVDPHDGTLYQNHAPRDRKAVGFARRQRNGDLIWGIRGTVFWKRTLSMPKPGKGDLYALTAPLGVAGDFTGAATYYSGYHILTRDGVYVDMIMNPPPSEGLGPNKVLCELFTGRLIRLTDSGRYLLLTGDQDGRIMEVHGLDSVKKLEGGTWTMTEAKVAKVEEAQRQMKESKKETLVINRGPDQLASATPVDRQLRGGLQFAARAARDEQNLYVRYKVTSPNPLVNGRSDPQTMFIGGNCLDSQMATNPEAPRDREEPAPGDVRLLITRQEEKTRAVLYEPEVKDFDGESIVMESPVDRETFDRITVVDGIELDYTPTGEGFTATATIPLKLLGWDPVSGQGVKMDLGYIFGDKTGRNALKRAYWSNNGFEANVVDDIPDESRLNPEFWGTAVVE